MVLLLVLQLCQERMRQLEQDLRERDHEVEGLRSELQASQRLHRITQEEVSHDVMLDLYGMMMSWKLWVA